MAAVTPTTTPFTLEDATRYYQGDITDNPEFSGYWNLYGDPPDSQDWWVRNNQLTPEATNWFTNARTGGNRTAAEQAAQDKDNLLGDFGPLAKIGAMIPGPWQPFAAAASAADSASTGDWLGALGAGYGAYSGFTSPTFKNPLPSLGNIFGGNSGGATANLVGEANAPMNFDGWSSDGMEGLQIGSEGDWYGSNGENPVGVGNESNWWSGTTTGTSEMPFGGTSGGNGLMDILKGMFAPQSGAYQFPWGKAISSLLGYMGTKDTQKDLQSLMREAMSAADPFAPERPRYQAQLRGLTSSPSSFFNDPAIAAAIGEAMNQSNRSLVSQGYNMSGNQMSELTKVAQNEAFKQFLPYLNQIGGFAGAGFGPGNAGNIGASMATNSANLGQQAYGNLGAGLNSILQGNQPNLLEMLKGQKQNPTLADVFKNALA